MQSTQCLYFGLIRILGNVLKNERKYIPLLNESLNLNNKIRELK
jgi:hypothetical protein